MKSYLKKLTLSALTLCVLLAGALQSNSQTTAVVNPHQPWIGFMNVFGINGDGTPNYGAYQFGSAWGIKDLRGYFDSTGTNFLTLTPCTNVWNPSDAYWVNADGTPNKWMDASFYVESGSIAGELVTFNGFCISNNLVAPASCVAFIKDFVPNYSHNSSVTAPLVEGQPFSIQLLTTPGDHIQIGFETQAADNSPSFLTNYVVIATDNTNISLLPLASLSLVEGQKATFAVNDVGGPATGYQWAFSNATTFTILSDGAQSSGSTVSGSASGTLIVSNVTLGDIGSYVVTATNASDIEEESASLVVQPKSLDITTNYLIDPSFESGAFASSSTAGWLGFNGAYIQNTNALDKGVNFVALNGSNLLQVVNWGANSYSGAFQDRPALPGQVFTALANFYNPSADPILGSNVCYLEVQFRNAANTPLVQYASSFVSSNSPLDTWMTLVPTNENAGDFNTHLGTSSYMVAPPGTTYARYQITHHTDAANSGGSVYADALDLRLRATPVSATLSGANVLLTFSTIYGPNFQVLYKTNLTDASWSLLTTVPGDGSVKTVTDSHATRSRFYTVQTQ